MNVPKKVPAVLEGNQRNLGRKPLGLSEIWNKVYDIYVTMCGVHVHYVCTIQNLATIWNSV